MSIFRERFACEGLFPHGRALQLFHQPARQHGGGILLHPKIEKRGDLLAEIGGMAETREFIALERYELGELDGTDPSSLLQRTYEPRHVPAKKIFHVR